MAPEFRSSFIPKNTQSAEVFQKKGDGPFGWVALLFFILSLLLSGALFAYKTILSRNIASLKNELELKESSIDYKTIETMATFSNQLKGAKDVLARHIIVSSFLEILNDSTPSTVRFTDFLYNIDQEGRVFVVMPGEAKDYSSIALLDRELKKSKYLKEVNFGQLDSRKGMVAFELNVSVDPSIAAYKAETEEPVDVVGNRSDDTSVENADDIDLSELEQSMDFLPESFDDI